MIAVKRVVNILFSVLLVLSLFPTIGFAATSDNAAAPSGNVPTGTASTDTVPTGTARAGTWFETAYATWPGKSAGGYRAYVRTLGAYDWRDNSAIAGWLVDWQEVDAQLVRKVDPARNTWRVDIPGLPNGEYEIQVRMADGTTVLHTFTDLKTRSFPRHGAAFVPSNANTFEGNHTFALNGAIGGYLPDGRVDPNAKIIYVTHENMRETLPSNVFSADRGSTANARTPLVIRFLGTVGSFETINSTVASSGTVGPAWLNNNRMIQVGQGNGNVTFEGIGPDATIFGWGISTSGAHNVEFRNLRFDQWYDDAIEINGANTTIRASNVWVHNNTFGYGQNKHLALNQDPDQAKGDGATDVTNHARNYTVSYNKYDGSSKVLLIGGGTTSISAHYGTLHHNWFLGSEERTPRVRNGRIHAFNNLFEDIQGHPYHNTLLDRNTGYGIGAAHNATVWAEGNIFDNVNYPFLRSRQGHARGNAPIDSTTGSGANHFFGDAPGFIIAREVVTEGDFPSHVDGFRRSSDYMTGLTETGLQSLRDAALSLQPNVLDDASRKYFDPKLDIGVVVAAGSTTTNPNMSTNPPAQLDWSFKPNRNGVWLTEAPEQAEALRKEIETHSGAMPAPAPDSAPAAPTISSVKINDELRSAFGEPTSFIPAPGRIVVYKDTFTIDWVSKDVLTDHYEIQWDKGSNHWETIGTVQASSRPNTFITQKIDQFANLKAILAQADSRDATYAFRVKAVNSFGESEWSDIYAINGDNLLVMFDSDGGSAVDPQRVRVGDAITVPARPKKDGWVFVGWYTDKTTGAHMWDFLNEKVAGSMVLNAKWVQVDETHRLLNAYASAEELESPYVAATLQTLGTLSANQRELTLPAGTTVYVAPGVYWTDLTYKEGGVIAAPNIGLSILGENITFLGLTENAADAIIAGNRGEGGANGLGANGSWYSLGISSGFHAENITIANYAQEDLVYPRDPSQNMPKRLDSKNHAEVLTRANGTGAPDRLYFKNTRFIGYLNMMIGLAPTRAYFLDSFFQLTDDAVFSGGVNVYENSTFHFFGNHPSFNGAGNGGINVLLGSKIVGMPQMTSTDVYLAKQTNAIGPNANGIFAIIDTQFTGRIESVDWENVVREDARHFVSNNTIGEGKMPLVISPSQPQTSVTLTGSALHAFKVGEEYNVYNLLKGNDGWDPKGQNNAEWAPYANLPYRFLVGTTGKTMYSDKTDNTNRAVLTPAPAPAASVDVKNIVWSYDTNLLNGTVDAATGVITLTARPNNTGAIIKTIVTGTLPSGVSAGATLNIRPTPVPAPVVTAPAIDISENLATLSYTLDQLGYKDTSVIEWYRETGPDTTNGIHIGTMRNDANEFFVDDPYKNYALNKYDVGYYLRAVITPKYEFSSAGAPITVYTNRAVTAADVTETSLYTDFKNLYVTNEDHTTTKDRWFFDRVSGTAVPWGWGIGTNGHDKIWGLQNNSGGTNTRFVFGQPGGYGDMSLKLNYSTGKVEGQGFGGNGHFMDIYVKYDPATRTGYGLRVERTATGGSNATMWTLYKYDGTNQIPLSQPLRTAAFMPKSTITVSVTGSTLRVQASTLSEKTPLQIGQNLPNSVDISWTDDTGALGNNMFGGFGIRINNSGNSSYDYAGSGATTNNTVMLHNVRVDASAAVPLPNRAPETAITSYMDGQHLNGNTPTVTWTFIDPDTGDAQAAYQVQGSVDNWATIAFDSGELEGTAASYTTAPLADGEHWMLRVRTKDSHGAWSNWVNRTLAIDTAAPTAKVSYTTVDPTNEDVVATIIPSEPVSVDNNNGAFSKIFGQNGSFTFTFTDAAGNTGSVEAVVNNIDKTAPVTADDAPKGWVNHNVTVNLSAADNGSGVKTTYYQLDGGAVQTGTAVNVTAEGTHKIEYWSADIAGNAEAKKTAVVQIDKTGPSLNVILDKTELWPANNKPVSVTATVYATDSLSQVESIVLTSITVSEPGDGKKGFDIQDAQYGTWDKSFLLLARKADKGSELIYTITYTATDKAGNKTVSTVSAIVPHDQSNK